MKIPSTNHMLPFQEHPPASPTVYLLFILGMTRVIGSTLSTIFATPHRRDIETLKVNARAAELQAHKVEAEAQRAHELQMQSAKGEDERKLKAEEQIFNKEKHQKTAEIYNTLARQPGYGCGFAKTSALKVLMQDSI